MAEPGGSGPIGPYPPGVEDDAERESYDRLRRRVLWSMPSMTSTAIRTREKIPRLIRRSDEEGW